MNEELLKNKPPEFPEPWAGEWGVDDYGYWMSMIYSTVVQRFRWIAPGKFLMGSPANEAERVDDETLHQVILTAGFWLADTACTQELWQAVMGNNLSRFKGKELPVENVSWEDCREFIDKLNQQHPELRLSFPTEAQWEYACRAGTATPFSFGENITPDQVNYNGSHPYNKGSEGVNRACTVPVKSLLCNDWGLYQMHGNVWEWCLDWYGNYPDGLVTDPRGPASGGFRVSRGGSWLGYGGGCRSANRFWWYPSLRFDSLGFRLSRGQQPLRQSGKFAEQPGDQEQEAAERPVGREGGSLRKRR